VPELLGDGYQSTPSAPFGATGNDFPFELYGNLVGSDCGWLNGPFVTGLGDGFNGANTSVATGTFGYGTQGGTINNRVADDFTVPAGDAWMLDQLSWKAYQTGAPTTGTITGINSDLWSADPSLGGSASQAGPANSLLSQTWTGAYRVSAGNELDPGRAIIEVVGDMSWASALTGGTYWVDVTLEGSLASGPWSPPVTPEGAGDALQSLSGGAYTALTDDFPFALSTLCASDGPEIYCDSKPNSCFVVPTIGGPTGLTSQGTSATGTYDMTVAPVPAAKFGLLFYSNGGKKPVPVLSTYGTLCVDTGTPVYRLPLITSTGTGCNGVFTVDFGGYLATQTANPLLTAAGLAVSGVEVVDAQFWYRDPLAPGGANYSNAIRFLVVP